MGAPLSVEGGGVFTERGLSLTVKGAKLYESWINPAGYIGWASFNAASWGAENQITGANPALGPAIDSYNGALYDAWDPDIPGTPIDYFVSS
jgi:hypothetical protein